MDEATTGGLCLTRIENSTFTGNRGIVIISDDKATITDLELSQNTFSQNFGHAIESRHNNVVDTNSVYIYNIVESASGVISISETTYQGTGITFESNEVYTNGGAVFATA